MSYYRIHRSRIVYEVLGSEVIVIDFNTGNYYALIHIGKLVWQLLEQEIPLEHMAKIFADHFKCEPDILFSDVKTFVEELLQNGLLEEVSDPNIGTPTEWNIDGWEYDPPKLQKYSDVQNLLLLDPIHEVAEGGWPDKLH